MGLNILKIFRRVIIVDSTRRGKRFPDALSKTIPIWCCVINGAIARRFKGSSDDGAELYTARVAVSRSEHFQIESRIEGWIEKLLVHTILHLCEKATSECSFIQASTFIIPNLIKPLRPIWLSPSSSLPDLSEESNLPFFPVVCLSASRHVDSQSDGLENRPGFTYVQGSGDDHELWSQV